MRITYYKPLHPRFMEFHMPLGLPFLHQLLEANIQDQTRMVRRTAETTDFLSHAQHAYLGVYHPASPFWEMTWTLCAIISD